MGQPLGRCVGAVRGGEGVVDVDVPVLRECRGEVGIVLLLALVKARVLQEQDIAVVHRGDGLLGWRSDAVGGKEDGVVQHLFNRR